MKKFIGIILISIFYLVFLRNATAGYYSDPDPQIDISDSQVSMKKELSGYPNYGVIDGKADVLYSEEENNWWFKLPPDLSYTNGQVTLSLVIDDHYDINESEYCARILVNGNELFSGSLASLGIKHGEPYGQRFNNWKLVSFPLQIDSHETKVTVVNCSNLSKIHWIAIDNINLVIYKSSPEINKVILWNKLGSESEVTHSEIGPNGEVVGKVLFESGKHGNGFRSAIRTGDRNIPNNFIRFPNLQLGPQGCIEFWYHPDWKDYQVGHVIDIIQYGIPEQEPSTKIIMGFNDGQDRGNAIIRNLPQSTGAFNYFNPSEDPNWTTLKPFHIAITWNKSLESDQVKLFFNGRRANGERVDGKNLQSPWLYDEPHYLYVGSRMYSGNWDRHHWEPNIDGVIDNIIVWNYAKTDFSHRFTENPLLVSLDSFSVTTLGNQVAIEWKTKTEIDNLGMNLWCAQMQGNQFQEITQLNNQLIPSKAILPNYGASYSSIDYPYVNTNLKPGVQHCALEDINANGQCTLHCDQIDTTVVGKDQNVTDVDLNEINAKAVALCHHYKDKLTETGQGGICLDQLLISY